jgi:hypothetical protein
MTWSSPSLPDLSPPSPLPFRGKAGLRGYAEHIPLVVETFDHALIPAYEAVKRTYDQRRPEDSPRDLALRAIMASAFPLTLGASVVGAVYLLSNYTQSSDWWREATAPRTFITRNNILDLGAGAFLGFVSGAVPKLRPQWVGEHASRDSFNGPSERGHRRWKEALKEGLLHTGPHLLDDIKLLAVMKVFFGSGV